MSKDYEKKAITAEMVMVDFDTQVSKRAGGTYDGTNIMFKAFGKVNEKGFTTKSYEFKPELRAQLEAVQEKGTLFTINQYREVGTQFWNIDSIDVGHTEQAPAAGGAAPAYNAGANPAAVGQAINLAVDVLGYKHADMLDVNKARKAIAWYHDVKNMWTDNFEGADKEPAPPVKKDQQGKPADFDDDIPF